MSELFPKSRRAAIERGLRAAFGDARPSDVQWLTGGLSGAGVCRLTVKDADYVLRIDGSADALRDRASWYACMAQAAAAGLAPPVRYADAVDGVAIIDFIATRPTAADDASRAERTQRIAQLVASLHALPAQPPPVDYMDGMDVLIARHHASHVLHSTATAELFAAYDRLRAVYRSDPADLVFGHNDVNPRNVLDDGARLWLIDWEAAFRADRYIDLAAVANAFTVGPDEETALLAAYFGEPPGALGRARLLLMRQVNHVFYALVILAGAAQERAVDGADARDLSAPPFAEIRKALARGDFDLGCWAGRVTYGKSRLALAMETMRSAAFEAALDRVASAQGAP